MNHVQLHKIAQVYLFCHKEIIIENNISSHLVDGQWSSWKPWSACTATCGKTATKYTTRTCDSPAPLYGIEIQKKRTNILNKSFVLGGNGCNGTAFNVTNCTELADCPCKNILFPFFS